MHQYPTNSARPSDDLRRSRSLAVRLVASISLLLSVAPAAVGQMMTADLSGTWRMAMDPDGADGGEGKYEPWRNGEGLPHTLSLPGSLQSQGFGDPPRKDSPWTTNLGLSMLEDERFREYTGDEDFGNPFWLTPDRVYVGVAWYAREIEVPADWVGDRVELVLERPHWGTTVFINGEQVGPQQDSLGMPHVHDLTEAVAEGGAGTHTVSIRVDNRLLMNVGKDAHGLGDQMHTNWHGIIGDISLRRTPRVWVENAQVYPNVSEHSARVVATIGNATGKAGEGSLSWQVDTKAGRPFSTGAVERRVSWDAGDETVVEWEIELGDAAPTWTEFDPNVLRLTTSLGEHESHTDFGLREITVNTTPAGSQFAVNGREVFLRGHADSRAWVETGYPAMDVETWKAYFARLKAFGLNHVRFHSWTPPRAAFEAGDELGMYIHAECATWPNFKYAPGLPGWLEAEGDRMLREFGNHPSFVLMGVGNEFWNGYKMNDAAPMIEPAIDKWREQDTRRFYTTGAGWPQAPANDFHITQDPRLQLYPGLRLTDPPRTDLDYGEFVSKQSVPIITHEIGQWCSYPDLSVGGRTADFQETRYLEMCEDGLKRAGLHHLADQLTDASGRFQTMLYKAEIESALRTEQLAGFQLLGLTDYPGHGFAPVGVLDATLRSKGYAGPSDYRRFCDDRVLLARFTSRVFERGEDIAIGFDIANYGEGTLNGLVDWRVSGSQSGEIARGSESVDAETGGLSRIADKVVKTEAYGPAEELTVTASVRGTTISNSWSLWVFPSEEAASVPSNVRVVRSLDAEAASLLEQGERVVVFSPPAYVDADTFGSFRPIFWNRALFTTQREHTLGALIDEDHPALAGFPSKHYVTWQWWDILFNSKPIPLDALGAQVEPIVRPIDDWVTPRSLGLIFEASVGAGKLLVCGADLETDLENRPAARALRESLLAYAAGDAFEPQAELSGWEVQRLFREPTAMQKLGASVTATNNHPGHGPELTIDGDLNTFWHTAWAPTRAEPPHSLEIDLGRPQTARGLKYTPRTDSANGRFATFRIEVSDAGYDWTEVATGDWKGSDKPQTVTWARAPTRYVRLTMLTSGNGQPYATAAEVEVLVD